MAKMAFIIVGDALKKLLNDNAGGLFQVLGYEKQAKSAEEVQLPLVAAFYSGGQFPGSGNVRKRQHDMTFDIQITVAAKSEVDLSVLEDMDATPAERAAAIAAKVEAASLASQAFESTVQNVYQILHNGENNQLGIDREDPPLKTIADFEVCLSYPRIESIKKDEPLDYGSLVVLTGIMIFKTKTTEYIEGAPVVIGDGIPLPEADFEKIDEAS